MDIQGFFTKKGLLLAAKLAAGSTLKITRVCAGAAETALTASALSQIRQTLSAGAARRNGDTAVLPVTLEAGMAGSAYTLRELGVYAQDPDEGEILYKVYRLSEPVEIRPSSRLVLRFYLEETVSQDLNVTVVRASAGLLTEADLEPLRSRVESRSVPARTEEVAASELGRFILSLPRLLTENLTIKASGTAAGTLDVEHFYGPGSLTVAAKAGETLTIGSLYAEGNRVPVSFSGIKFQGAQPFSNTFLTIHSSALFTLNGCSVQGTGKTFDAVNTSTSAVYLNECGFTGVSHVLIPGNRALIAAYNCTASGNSVGVYGAGGAVFLMGSTPELLGGAANGRYNGGLIVKADGTLI